MTDSSPRRAILGKLKERVEPIEVVRIPQRVLDQTVDENLKALDGKTYLTKRRRLKRKQTYCRSSLKLLWLLVSTLLYQIEKVEDKVEDEQNWVVTDSGHTSTIYDSSCSEYSSYYL